MRTNNELLQVRLKIAMGNSDPAKEEEELIKLKDKTIDELLDKLSHLKDS